MAAPRVVLFDIGSTLWSSPAEDPSALESCYSRGRQILLGALQEVPALQTLIDAVEGYFSEWEDIWRTDAARVHQAPTTDFVVTALARIGVLAPPDALKGFTDALLETSVGTARVEPPEPGMKEALTALRTRGLRLGCVSNAFMGAATLNRIMNERGFGDLLDGTVSSCELGIRKPDPAIYEAGLEMMGATAAETVFVGDRLDADVEGPAALGMRTVLTHQYRQEDPSSAKVRPDRVIKHLSELAPWLDTLNDE